MRDFPCFADAGFIQHYSSNQYVSNQSIHVT